MRSLEAATPGPFLRGLSFLSFELVFPLSASQSLRCMSERLGAARPLLPSQGFYYAKFTATSRSWLNFVKAHTVSRYYTLHTVCSYSRSQSCQYTQWNTHGC
eukprot:TRINITY_DN87362_c0_g1_i1.p1 TRINITY_DN87362_c0_g1~~TRINITY_DN87362_c0_g1_i1.p1  ORF type:complete len:102 (-),score=1.06 TRINITY_DN87362_c0_g1_i1:31-336(-)